MKVALVHDFLLKLGGAERVLKVLSDLYPKAPIFTLLYDEKKVGPSFYVKPRPQKPRTQYKILFSKDLLFGPCTAIRDNFSVSFIQTYFRHTVKTDYYTKQNS